MCVLDGPWSLQAARRANCNWVLHRRPLLLRLLGATYLLPCPPMQQVLQHQPHFLHLSQYLCLHFAIVVDEYFKYSACLPPTNLPARCVPTNKTGATPQKQFLLPSHNIWWKPPYFVCVIRIIPLSNVRAAYTLLVVLTISFKIAATSF